MIEAKIGPWIKMSFLSGSDCIVAKQESVTFPNAIITLRLAGNLWQRFPECQHAVVCVCVGVNSSAQLSDSLPKWIWSTTFSCKIYRNSSKTHFLLWLIKDSMKIFSDLNGKELWNFMGPKKGILMAKTPQTLKLILWNYERTSWRVTNILAFISWTEW